MASTISFLPGRGSGGTLEGCSLLLPERTRRACCGIARDEHRFCLGRELSRAGCDLLERADARRADPVEAAARDDDVVGERQLPPVVDCDACDDVAPHLLGVAERSP